MENGRKEMEAGEKSREKREREIGMGKWGKWKEKGRRKRGVYR